MEQLDHISRTNKSKEKKRIKTQHQDRFLYWQRAPDRAFERINDLPITLFFGYLNPIITICKLVIIFLSKLFN